MFSRLSRAIKISKHAIITFIIQLSILLLATSCLATNSEKNTQKTPIAVQLNWSHQFEFAAFYAAIELGFFEEYDLDVTLIEGGPQINTVNSVLNDKAEFGIGNSSLVVDFNNGKPIMAIASYIQHSPFVILARREEGLESPKDLEGRTLMVETQIEEIKAYLTLAGVDLNKINMVPHTGDIRSIAKASTQNIDATTAYITTEPYQAAKYDIPYKIFNPRSLDIDFYSDTLFTSQSFAKENPKIVNNMMLALEEGWYYAINNPNEIIELIIKKYAPHKDNLELEYEANTIMRLLDADVVDIGYMSYQRWHYIAEIFLETGEIDSDVTIDGFLFEAKRELPIWLKVTAVFTLLFFLFAACTLYYVLNINRRLKSAIRLSEIRAIELQRVNQKLEQLSYVDGLTGVANRRCFDNTLEKEFYRLKRSKLQLGLILIDVDYFKLYNDHYGHVKGDECLQAIAKTLAKLVSRSSDLLARYGGEEFSIIIAETNSEKLLSYSEHIRMAVENLNITHEKSNFGKVTISVGAAIIQPEKILDRIELIKLADKALYQAKNSGRNTSHME